jgi:hypothetical protein
LQSKVRMKFTRVAVLTSLLLGSAAPLAEAAERASPVDLPRLLGPRAVAPASAAPLPATSFEPRAARPDRPRRLVLGAPRRPPSAAPLYTCYPASSIERPSEAEAPRAFEAAAVAPDPRAKKITALYEALTKKRLELTSPSA